MREDEPPPPAPEDQKDRTLQPQGHLRHQLPFCRAQVLEWLPSQGPSSALTRSKLVPLKIRQIPASSGQRRAAPGGEAPCLLAKELAVHAASGAERTGTGAGPQDSRTVPWVLFYPGSSLDHHRKPCFMEGSSEVEESTQGFEGGREPPPCSVSALKELPVWQRKKDKTTSPWRFVDS